MEEFKARKIPADARHITWGTQATAYSRRFNGWVGGSWSEPIPEDELLELIGNDRIIVLTPKGD